jgi:hypothetical protein
MKLDENISAALFNYSHQHARLNQQLEFMKFVLTNAALIDNDTFRRANKINATLLQQERDLTEDFIKKFCR